MGCGASTSDDKEAVAPNTRVASPKAPGDPPALTRKPSQRFTHADLSAEERAQLEAIAKKRSPQYTLSNDEASLARYEAVTFGIKDTAADAKPVLVVASPTLQRKQSIIRRVEEVPQAAEQQADQDDASSCSQSANRSQSSLTRSQSKKNVKFKK